MTAAFVALFIGWAVGFIGDLRGWHPAGQWAAGAATGIAAALLAVRP